MTDSKLRDGSVGDFGDQAKWLKRAKAVMIKFFTNSALQLELSKLKENYADVANYSRLSHALSGSGVEESLMSNFNGSSERLRLLEDELRKLVEKAELKI